jgi:hypothetical protein
LNWNAPFLASDLEELDARLLSLADRVVPMRDIAKGDTNHRVIGLRHDVDDNAGSFDTALRLARWEFDHGYSSTYFLLHGAWYWDVDHLVDALEFQELGHEVGIHVNAIAEALRLRRSPDWILREALGDLRSVGVRVDGAQAHGDALCYAGNGMTGDLKFVNDEIFTECARPALGDPDRTVKWKRTEVKIEPLPLADYYLTYHASHLPRGNYLSDSGGRWSQSFDDVVDGFGEGQLHILMHPDWWGAAFPLEVTV